MITPDPTGQRHNLIKQILVCCVIIGPRKDKIILACVGATYSVKINFKASANACNTP